jgi:hypothetical protein
MQQHFLEYATLFLLLVRHEIPPGHAQISDEDFKQREMIKFSMLYRFDPKYRCTQHLGTNWARPKIDLYSTLCTWMHTQNVMGLLGWSLATFFITFYFYSTNTIKLWNRKKWDPMGTHCAIMGTWYVPSNVIQLDYYQPSL